MRQRHVIAGKLGEINIERGISEIRTLAALAGVDSRFYALILPVGFFRPYGAGGLGCAVSQSLRRGLFSSLPPGGLWRFERSCDPRSQNARDRGSGHPAIYSPKSPIRSGALLLGWGPTALTCAGTRGDLGSLGWRSLHVMIQRQCDPGNKAGVPPGKVLPVRARQHSTPLCSPIYLCVQAVRRKSERPLEIY